MGPRLQASLDAQQRNLPRPDQSRSALRKVRPTCSSSCWTTSATGSYPPSDDADGRIMQGGSVLVLAYYLVQSAPRSWFACSAEARAFSANRVASASYTVRSSTQCSRVSFFCSNSRMALISSLLFDTSAFLLLPCATGIHQILSGYSSGRLHCPRREDVQHHRLIYYTGYESVDSYYPLTAEMRCVHFKELMRVYRRSCAILGNGSGSARRYGWWLPATER